MNLSGNPLSPEPPASAGDAVPVRLAAQRDALQRALAEAPGSAPARPYPSAALDVLIEGLPAAAIVADGAGRLLCANEAARRLLDMTAEEASRVRLDLLAEAEDSLLVPRLLQVLEVQPSTRLSLRMLRRSPPAIDVSWDIGRLTLGRDAYLLILISDQRAHQQATTVLAAAQGQLARSRKMESTVAIAGRVVHDLQNKLAPLVAYPDLLQRSGRSAESADALLDGMRASVAGISRKLQQFQTILHCGRQTPAPADLNETAAQAASVLRETAADRPIEIIMDLASAPPAIAGVRDMLLRAADNLCRNALDAVRGSGRITVATRVESPSTPAGCRRQIPPGTYVVLSVADTGAGLPPDLPQRLLRSATGAAASGGDVPPGLGLTVVREIMDEHRGFVDLAGEPGRGAVVSLWFPALPCAAPEPPPAKRDKAGALRILLADDEAHIRRLFHMILSDAFPGVLIETATGGAEAIQRFESHRPDVIVMDLRMPGVDGEAVYRHIESRCRERGWRMPGILFCTGFAPPEFIRLLAGSGQTHRILSKPVRDQDLVDAVRQRLAEAPA